MGAPVFFLFAFIVMLSIAGTILWIWALVDCATNEPSDSNDKIVWILIIIFTHSLGALLYMLVRRPQRIEETCR